MENYNKIELIKYYNALLFINAFELVYYRFVNLVLSWFFVCFVFCLVVIKFTFIFCGVCLLLGKYLNDKILKFYPQAHYRVTIRKIKNVYEILFSQLRLISVEELVDKESTIYFEVSQNYLSLTSGSLALVLFSFVDWNVSKITNLSVKHLQIVSDFKYLTG